jgi:hypothetical protein
MYEEVFFVGLKDILEQNYSPIIMFFKFTECVLLFHISSSRVSLEWQM